MYRIEIVDESGKGLPGLIIFYDADGLQIGNYEIPVGGIDLPADMVTVSSAYHIDSPGYIGYDTTHLDQENTVTLVEDTNLIKPITVAFVLIGLFVASRLLNK